MRCLAAGYTEKLLEGLRLPAKWPGILSSLNDRLLTAEERQAPLVEAGRNILNALKQFHNPGSMSKTAAALQP
jgi:hypothetical protein